VIKYITVVNPSGCFKKIKKTIKVLIYIRLDIFYLTRIYFKNTCQRTIPQLTNMIINNSKLSIQIPMEWDFDSQMTIFTSNIFYKKAYFLFVINLIKRTKDKYRKGRKLNLRYALVWCVLHVCQNTFIRW